jgi:hypothetical protein
VIAYPVKWLTGGNRRKAGVPFPGRAVILLFAKATSPDLGLTQPPGRSFSGSKVAGASSWPINPLNVIHPSLVKYSLDKFYVVRGGSNGLDYWWCVWPHHPKSPLTFWHASLWISARWLPVSQTSVVHRQYPSRTWTSYWKRCPFTKMSGRDIPNM